MKRIFYTLLAFSFLSHSNLIGQTVECGCTNCPLFLPDGEQDTLFLNVQGVINDNLASPFQGVCGINLVFNHQYLGDLVLTLISPSGQEVQLIGPADFHGATDGSIWDIDFVPCSETPVNPFFLDKFDSEILTATNFNFTGSYWPAGNPNTGGAALECLEDFDVGPVNGEWKIFIEDNLAIDVGEFVGFEIEFCDPTGLSDCALNPCGVFIDLDGPGLLCEDFDEDLVLDASGSEGGTFVWGADNGGTFDGTPSGPIVNILTPGTYYLTVSDPGDNLGSCIEIDTFVVPEFSPVPEIGITQSAPLSCDNQEITLESTSNLPGSTGIEIWVKDGDINNGQATEDLVVTEPGDYTLTVINLSTGCETSETITITDESVYPTAEANVDGVLTCDNDMVIISGDSDTGVSYNWEGPNDFTSDDQTFDVMEGGMYNLTVTSDNGCTEIANIEVVIDTISPNFTVTASGELDCLNTATNLNIVTNETYTAFEWQGPNNYTNTVEESPLVELGGTYTLIATNANGCTSSSTVEVVQSADVPTISTVDDGAISCTNSEYAISGTSTTNNVSYSWSGPNNFTSTDADLGMVTDTGTYTLTVLAPNGCSVSSSVFVDADTLSPEVMIETPNLLGCSNIITTLITNTTESNLSYDWSGPNSQSYDVDNPTIEGPGIYNLTVTGENGCINDFSVEVQSDDTPPTIDISILPGDIITCAVPEVGLINGNDDPDYTYEWSGPGGYTYDNSDPMLSVGGEYFVTVTGANGCTDVASITAIENTASPDIEFTTAEITCTEEVVSIGVSSTETITQYAWTGDNGYTSTVQNPDNITESGEYTAVITAENGCTNTITFDVTESINSPDGQIIFEDGFTFDCNLTSLSLLGSSETPNATLQWQDPIGVPIAGDDIEAPSPGTYILIVTAPNGCTQELMAELDEDLSGPEILSNPDVDLFCSEDVSLGIESDETIVSYAWSGPNSFNSGDVNPMVGAVGQYDVIVTGENGCTSASSVQVIDQQTPPDIFVDPTQTLVCGQDQLNINGGSNELDVSYNWTTMGGNIVSNTDQAMIAVNAQGSYILTVTNNDNGCTETAEVIVNQDNDTPIAEINAIENTINCDVSSIQLNAENSDSGNGFTYEWGNNGGDDISNETTLLPTITQSGTYFITVTNTANQCTAIGSITIESDTELPNIELSNIEELNCLEDNITIENIAINSSNNLAYNWEATTGGNITSVNNLSQIDVDMPGTYTVFVTNTENGCPNELSFEVTQDITPPLISAGNNLTLDCGIESLELEGTISSIETDITVLWTTDNGTILEGEDTFEPQIGSASTYTLSVTNNLNGCESISEVTVDPNQDLPVIEFEPTSDFDCNTTSLMLDASASTSGTGINYQWTNDEGQEIFDADTPNPEIFEPGAYTLTVLNTNNNCENSQTINIGADTTAPSLVLAQADELSCTVFEVDLGVSSDLTGLDLQWIAQTGNIVSGATTSSPVVNQAGEYELTVTDPNNSCTSTASVAVTLDENTPTVDIAPAEELTCSRSEFTLDASNSSQGVGITSSWTNDGGNIVSGEDGLNPVINMPGTYTLTITDDGSGCNVSQSVTITQNTFLPSINIDMPDEINCNNPSIGIQAINLGNSDYNYIWITTNGNIIDGDNTLNPNIDEDGEYILIATDTQNGCDTLLSITVDKDIEPPVVSIGDNYEITCTEDIITVNGNGSSTGPEFNYTWSDASGSEIGNDLSLDFTSEGTFTLEITNSDNGCSENASIIIEDIRLLPDVVIEQPATITCEDETVELVATNQINQVLEYTWVDEMGNTLNTNLTASSIDVSAAGNYTLFVIDPANGCDQVLSVNVESNQENPEVMVTAANAGEIDCDNPTISLTGTIDGLNQDDVLINWTTVGGNFFDGQNTLNPTVSSAGEYQLEITNISNGCSNMDQVSVTQDDAIPLSTLNDPEQLDCNVLSTTLMVPNNPGNVEISWTLNGIPIRFNSNEIIVDEPGEYMVEIINLDNGCSSMDNVFVDQDIESPIIDAGETFELQCNVTEYEIQGLIDGNANYEIEWDPGSGNISSGATTLNPTIDEPGLYTLLVVNQSNGCISTDDVTITVNPNTPTDLMANAQDPLCEDDLGSISITNIEGGEGPFTYSIDGGMTYSDLQDYEELAPGTYQLTALDANECLVTQEVSIDPPLDIQVDLEEEVEILVGDSAQLIANLININPDDIQSIQWTPSAGLSCDDCLNPTTSSPIDILYNLEVTLGSGCFAFDEIQLRVDRDLNIYVPNAFSPFNLDGANDMFYLYSKENVVTNINTFAIYDRWGEQVFLRENILANDSSQGWNGEYRNEQMPLGVYIYYFEVEYRDGSKEIIKGDVLLAK